MTVKFWKTFVFSNCTLRRIVGLFLEIIIQQWKRAIIKNVFTMYLRTFRSQSGIWILGRIARGTLKIRSKLHILSKQCRNISFPLDLILTFQKNLKSKYLKKKFVACIQNGQNTNNRSLAIVCLNIYVFWAARFHIKMISKVIFTFNCSFSWSSQILAVCSSNISINESWKFLPRHTHVTFPHFQSL